MVASCSDGQDSCKKHSHIWLIVNDKFTTRVLVLISTLICQIILVLFAYELRQNKLSYLLQMPNCCIWMEHPLFFFLLMSSIDHISLESQVTS